MRLDDCETTALHEASRVTCRPRHVPVRSWLDHFRHGVGGLAYGDVAGCRHLHFRQEISGLDAGAERCQHVRCVTGPIHVVGTESQSFGDRRSDEFLVVAGCLLAWRLTNGGIRLREIVDRRLSDLAVKSLDGLFRCQPRIRQRRCVRRHVGRRRFDHRLRLVLLRRWRWPFAVLP